MEEGKTSQETFCKPGEKGDGSPWAGSHGGVEIFGPWVCFEGRAGMIWLDWTLDVRGKGSKNDFKVLGLKKQDGVVIYWIGERMQADHVLK